MKNGSDSPDNDEALLKFPLTLSVKAIGLAETEQMAGGDDPDFKTLVSGIVAAHLHEHQRMEITTLPSKAGKYLSVRVRFTADSREQLEAIYQALHQSDQVLFAL